MAKPLNHSKPLNQGKPVNQGKPDNQGKPVNRGRPLKFERGSIVNLWALRVAFSFSVVLSALSTPIAAAGFNEAASAMNGVVVAESSPWAWVSDRAGLVTAIDLSDGSARWRGPARGSPLALYQGQLVVMTAPDGAGKLNILLVDPQTGSVDRGFIAELPEAVVASPAALPSQRFEAWTSVENGLLVSWEYQWAPLRGALMGADNSVSRMQSLEGAVLLDLNVSSATPALADQQARRRDLAADGRLAQLDGTQFRSGDSSHVLVANAIEDPKLGWKWRWQLHERSSGEALGHITAASSTAPFWVRGNRVIWQADPIDAADGSGRWVAHGSRLLAQNLANDKIAWSFDIADRIYLGTLPP